MPAPRGDQPACPVHDSQPKTWRHLDFFQHQAYLHARVPRVTCPIHGTRQVRLPWARQGSGFRLLFEALLMALLAQMPVKAVADLVSEHDTRLWRLLHHHVEAARAKLDLAESAAYLRHHLTPLCVAPTRCSPTTPPPDYIGWQVGLPRKLNNAATAALIAAAAEGKALVDDACAKRATR